MSQELSPRLILTVIAVVLVTFNSLGLAHGQSSEDAIAALSSSQPNERIRAVQVLGEKRAFGAVEALSRTLRSDPYPEVRGWAARALHRIGTETALGAVMLAAEGDADDRVRALAARLLSNEATTGAPSPAPEASTPEAASSAVEASVPASGSPGQPALSARLTITVAAPNAAPAPAPAPAPSAAPVPAQVENPFSANVPPMAPPPVVTVQPQVEQEPIVVATPAAPTSRDLLLEQRRLRRAGLGLRIVGWSLFALGYFEGSIVTGSILMDEYEEGFGIALIPLIGPIIAAARLDEAADDWGDELSNVLFAPMLVIGAVMQIAGLGLAIGGHVRRARVRREAAQLAARRSVTIYPTALGLAGTF